MANAQGSDNITQIVGEKLDNKNFAEWKFGMMIFLVGRDYWDLCIGDEAEPELPERPTRPTQEQIRVHRQWKERACEVLHWFSVRISDAMAI